MSFNNRKVIIAWSASDRLWTRWLKLFLAGEQGELSDCSLARWGKEKYVTTYILSCLHIPRPLSQVAVLSLSHWFLCVFILALLVPFSSIGAAKFQPCLISSYFCAQFLSHDFLFTLIMEVVSTSETLVSFCETTHCKIPEDSHHHLPFAI
jgi:hypothetical protein